MISNKYHIKSVYMKPVLAVKMGIFSKSKFQVEEKNFKNFRISWWKWFFMTFPRIVTYFFKFYKKFATNSCVIHIWKYYQKQFTATFPVKLKLLERFWSRIQKYSYICIYSTPTFYTIAQNSKIKILLKARIVSNENYTERLHSNYT